jgi:hypothetical protein
MTKIHIPARNLETIFSCNKLFSYIFKHFSKYKRLQNPIKILDCYTFLHLSPPVGCILHTLYALLCRHYWKYRRGPNDRPASRFRLRAKQAWGIRRKSPQASINTSDFRSTPGYFLLDQYLVRNNAS